MGNYTFFQMFKNPRRGRHARNFTTNVPKILDLELSSEQIFSENWRWVPLFRRRFSIQSFCKSILVGKLCMVIDFVLSSCSRLQFSTFSLRPCPHVSVFVWKRNSCSPFSEKNLVHSKHFRPSTRIRWIDLKTITYPTEHAWRIRVRY